MSNNSSIEWCDTTWNPVSGCDRVSAGCDHCYALTLAKRLKAMGNPRYQVDGNPKTSGPGFGVTLHSDKLTDPLHWRKPQKVFVNSMSDLFHAEVPTEFIDCVFAAMALAPQHTFQILTKRPQRMAHYLGLQNSQDIIRATDEYVKRARNRLIGQEGIPSNVIHPWSWPLPNVWLGTSVENQEAAYRIDWLVKTPAAIRFLSCEPLLGPLDLSKWLWTNDGVWDDYDGEEIRSREGTGHLHWIIAGGESGHGFRPVDLNWLRELRDQCHAAGVPYFMKQIGGRTPKAGGRELDGRTWDQMPEVA